MALVDVVKPLQQHEQAGLAAAGLADQPDPLACIDAEAELVEHLQAAGIAERYLVEDDRRPGPYQRLGLGMVAQFMGNQKRCGRLRQPRDMLGDIDQRHREIARGIQNGKPQGADQHHVAGGGAAALPQHDRPGQQRDGQDDGDRGMGEPQLFEVTQAAAPRRQFPVDRGVEPVVFVAEAAKRPHQRHVVDDIDHFAIDGGGLVGKVVMQAACRRRPDETSQSPSRRRRRSILPPSAGSRFRSARSPQRLRCMAASHSRRTCSRR